MLNYFNKMSLPFKVSKLTASKILRNSIGNPPPIVCYAYFLGKKDTNCDCVEFCKHSPSSGSPLSIAKKTRFNYVDDFDYGAALADLKKNKELLKQTI